MKRESVSVFIPSSYRAARQARQNWTNPSAHRRLHDSFYMIDVSPWKHVFKNTRQIAACFQLMTSVIHENHEIKQRFCLFAFKVCFNLTAALQHAVCLHGAAGLRNSVWTGFRNAETAVYLSHQDYTVLFLSVQWLLFFLSYFVLEYKC